MNTLGRLCFGGIGIIVMLLAGCVTGPTRLEADYGASVDLARFQQRLDPEAGKNLEPVLGFDGSAAAATVDRYRGTFEKPPPSPFFTFNIGTR